MCSPTLRKGAKLSFESNGGAEMREGWISYDMLPLVLSFNGYKGLNSVLKGFAILMICEEERSLPIYICFTNILASLLLSIFCPSLSGITYFVIFRSFLMALENPLYLSGPNKIVFESELKRLYQPHTF